MLEHPWFEDTSDYISSPLINVDQIIINPPNFHEKRKAQKMQQGILDIGQNMSVQALYQELLQNGIDFSSVNGDHYK